MKNKERFVISVLVADRTGILRDITSAVTALGGNMDGISQTVVEGYFTVILTATFDAPQSESVIREAITANFGENEAAVVVRRFDLGAAAGASVDGDRYIVTLVGADRKGILQTVTGFLAEKGINIENWYVVFEGSHVTHIGEVTMPALLDVRQLHDEFRARIQPLELNVFIQHENIFRVTNEVGAVSPMIAGEGRT